MDRLLDAPSLVPAAAQVDGVPFVKQAKDHCGPAALAMVLEWSGRFASLDTLSSQMFTPGRSGTLQTDLVGAVRRQGYLGIKVNDAKSLFEEVAAGRPVIVFQNVGFTWYPIWHYAVVIGYDLPRREITLHSGTKERLTTDLSDFEKEWSRGGYWALVVLPPSLLSASGDEIAHLSAAAELERMGIVEAAEISYRRILERWPHSLGALVGLANLHDSRGETGKAVRALREAVSHHPKSAAAWHNLALAHGARFERKRARVAALKALELADEEETPTYRESLKAFLLTR